MKLAVVGKGGVGKTTTSAVIARALARRGASVVALDCDTNPNLGISLGLGESATEALVAARQALDEGDEEHAPGWDDLLERFGSDAPDGVRLAVVTRIDNPEPGCPCCGLSAEQLLRSVPADDIILVADLEAGLGTLTRMGDDGVDVVLVVVEASTKSLEVAARAIEMIQAHSLGRVIAVANRVREDADVDAIRAALPDVELAIIPEDPAIVSAERNGEAPLDVAPDSPAVRALLELADRLAPALSGVG